MTKQQLCLVLLASLGLSCVAAPTGPGAAALPSAVPVTEQASHTTNGLQASQHQNAQSYVSRYDLRAVFWGNLFYQLNCLAGQGFCSEAAFRALWEQELGWNQADAQQLAAFQVLRQQYSRQLQFAGPAEIQALPPRFEGIRTWDKVLQAAMNADSRQALAQNLALAMRPQDAEALMGVLQHFAPRFESWWLDGAEAVTRSAAEAFAAAMQQQNLTELVQQASRFYRAELSDYSLLSFNFLARPALERVNSVHGEQIENQSLVEVRENAPVQQQIPVVLHELCHYLFKRSSRADEARRLQAFLAADNTAEGMAAYHLLDEVLATAIGNGLAGQRLLSATEFEALRQRPGAFYNDDWIDPLAKALYPRVAQALQAGEAVHDEAFVKDYLRLARDSLGSRLQSPVPLLRTLGGAYHPELATAFSDLQQQLRAGVTWAASGLDVNARSIFERHDALSGVIMLRPADLPLLSDWDPILGRSAREAIQAGTGSRVYGVQRNARAYLFVLVAATPAEARTLSQRLLQQPRWFSGPMP
ncbi:MAG: hypothetical protein IGS03_11585 [Candidatus Sericytochromatia bacterium]|nr:hypothetical protein [Candidatus Sericytochromatia bacterium]